MVKRKNTSRKGLPVDLKPIESSQGRCPGGHLLPHHTNKGRCTPVYCPGSLAGTNDRQPVHETKGEAVSNTKLGAAIKASKHAAIAEVSRQADTLIDSMIPGDTIAGQAARIAAKAQKAEELVKLGHAIGRWAAMRSYFKVPEGLEGAAAEEFVRKKAELLSVDMIVDLERDMKLGDDTTRREARRDLADMLGIRKRAEAPRATNVFIIQAPNGKRPVAPWEQDQVVTVKPVQQPAPVPSLPPGPKGEEKS